MGAHNWDFMINELYSEHSAQFNALISDLNCECLTFVHLNHCSQCFEGWHSISSSGYHSWKNLP